MIAGLYALTIEQGSTFERVITWRDAAGDLVDLTGYTARMKVKKNVNAAVALLELTTENGRIALDPVLGTITLTATAADTAALSGWTDAVYDLELVSAAGIVTRLLEGRVWLSKEVTV